MFLYQLIGLLLTRKNEVIIVKYFKNGKVFLKRLSNMINKASKVNS